MLFLSSADRLFISDLKSKLSRVLTFKKRLEKVEQVDLEEIYKLTDYLITKGDNAEGVEIFKDSMSIYAERSKMYEKPYVKEQIVPLIQKACNRNWGKRRRRSE